MPLVAHLRGDAGLLCYLGNVSGFPQVMCKRLLAVDVLARPHRHCRDVGVQMVRRGAQHSIDALFLLQHDAEVFVSGAAAVGRLLAIVLFDLLLNGPPASHAFEVELLEAE